MIRSLVRASDTVRAAFWRGTRADGSPSLRCVPVLAWAAVDFGGSAENLIKGIVLWQGVPAIADDIDVFCGYMQLDAGATNPDFQSCVAQARLIQKARDKMEVN